MAFDINTKANIAFKQIKAKAHTSNSRDPVNEPFVTRSLLTSKDIWAQPISQTMSIATAVSEGIIGHATAVDLSLSAVSGTNDLSSKYSAYTLTVPGTVPAGLVGKVNPLTGAEYAPGDRVSNIILEAYSNQNFRVHLYTNSGKAVEVAPLDACDWTIDPVAGIVVQETDVVASMLDLSSAVLSCYVYVGDTAQSATATAGSTSLDLAYNQGSVVGVDKADLDLQLNGYGFTVSDATGANEYVSVKAGETVISNDLDVQAIKGDYVTTAIPFDNVGVTALSTNLSATSIVGAINENADDLHTLINTTLTSKTNGSSGADGIGVTGIIGVLPEGGTVGADATLQAMLEGLAKSAGGLKTFASIAAFTASKAAGDYLPVNTIGYIKDIDRMVMVLVEGVAVVEGTDYDVLWDINQPLGGTNFRVTSTSVQIVPSGVLTLTGTESAVLTGDDAILTLDKTVALSAKTGNKVTITSDTETEINGGALVDINATAVTIDGDVAINGASNDDFKVTTIGATGGIFLKSEFKTEIDTPVVNVTGDVVIAANKILSVDKINISSVDPTDAATITGQRTGIPFTGNKLKNPGFEKGSGANADDWTEGPNSGRDATEKYFDNYSFGYEKSSELGGDVPILTQAITGLNLTNHIVSVWFKGSTQSSVDAVLNGTTVEIVPANTSVSVWTRFYKDVTPGTAAGNFSLVVNGVAVHNNHFYVDALQVEEKAALSAPTGFFSTYMSELILRVGNNAEDKISFQSVAPVGGTIKELMAIDNSQVRVYGDLIVDGATTTINSTTLAVQDNKVTLNNGMTGDPATNMPNGEAGIEVIRGSSAKVAVRWNETTDKWELTNDGTTYGAIVTVGGSSGISMDTAYNGGSVVTVDNTNVSFDLALTKSFTVSDPTDASKFVVSAGSGADSIKIDTTGGVDIDVDGGFVVSDNSGASFELNTSGEIGIYGASNSTVTLGATGSGWAQLTSQGNTKVSSSGTGVESIKIDTLGGIDINAAATSPITMDSGSFSIDGVLASNVSVTGADLTLSTITSGNVVISSDKNITFNDEFLTTALPLGQTGYTGLVTEFAYNSQTGFNWSARDIGITAPTSIIGAINTNREDLWQYVELLATQGAAVGVAAGANLIGVDGIVSVIPTGKTLGANSNLQEMLEGIASSGGGSCKHFASEAAFKTAKAGGEYFNLGTQVYFIDTEREARVLTQSVNAVEGADWAYLWSTVRPLAGPAFVVESASVDIDVAGSVAIDGATGITLDSVAAISLDSTAASNFSVAGANLTLSTATSGNVVINAATTVDIDGAAIDMDSTGTVTINSGTDKDITLTTAGTGDVVLAGNGVRASVTGNTGVDAVYVSSSGGVQVTSAGLVDITSGTFSLDTTGAGADSIKIDTLGGIDIDVDGGFRVDDAGGSKIAIGHLAVFEITAANGLVVDVNGTGNYNTTIVGGSFNLDIVDNSTSSAFKLRTISGGIDIDTAATKPITMDSGSFSIDGVLASNVSVTAADLTLSTITSGSLVLGSAGALTLKDSFLTAGLPLSETGHAALTGFAATSIVGALNEVRLAATSANTLDEIYDGEAGTRTVTMDNGSVLFKMTDTYEFNVADSAAAKILSVKALAAGDKVDIVGALDVSGDSTFDKVTMYGNLDQSNGTVVLNATGNVDIDSTAAFTVDAASFSLDATTASNVTVAGAALTLSTTGAFDVNVTAGKDVVVSAVAFDANLTGALTVDSIGASSITTSGGSLTLATVSSGAVIVSSIGAVTVDGTGISIDGTAASNFTVNGNSLTLSTVSSGNVVVSSAGELTFKDSRTAAIPFSDAGATALPGGATSILGALKTAYEKSIDIGYGEKDVNSTDVTNDYVVVTIEELPINGVTFPATPTALRTAGVYASVYLNGLRLSDTEWKYNYAGSVKQITFNGSNDIVLVSGDKIMVEVNKIN